MEEKIKEKISDLLHDLYVISELLSCGLHFKIDAGGIHPDFRVLSVDQIYINIEDSLTLKEIREELRKKTMQQLPQLLREAVTFLCDMLIS